ncbi:flavodoxin domain-containing protein [Patescibacteria group bacterium]|nr:flavodoxin domain-containing protein [Patescibacteria group bacterium]MBU1075209.1 flavodoxin domain-containing protein [Patescibacteria group bacterium]MBU1951769.1 flavodoxin domain-containing protein [Patescibacteria group bacterium]MBU2229308.1 flavodoxin domain-containing protein [Patescibacteria group bacterium]MBU2235732.1 flavodoxin domain-containing protein [Patescibacteria group bacterium]
MNTIILYKSKWGATKQYAEWIHEAYPESDIEDLNKFDVENFSNYDIVVIGSRTYMGRILVGKFLTGNWNKLKDKKVYLFSVGMMLPDSEESKMSFKLIPEDIRSSLVGYSKLPGKIEAEKLNFLVKKFMKKHKGPTDKIDRNSIKPIVDFLIQNAQEEKSDEEI